MLGLALAHHLDRKRGTRCPPHSDRPRAQRPADVLGAPDRAVAIGDDRHRAEGAQIGSDAGARDGDRRGVGAGKTETRFRFASARSTHDATGCGDIATLIPPLVPGFNRERFLSLRNPALGSHARHKDYAPPHIYRRCSQLGVHDATCAGSLKLLRRGTLLLPLLLGRGWRRRCIVRSGSRGRRFGVCASRENNSARKYAAHHDQFHGFTPARPSKG